MTEINMRLEDWLDDLCVRFIVNLPREELESVERICFQVEEAQWFYEDFIRPLDPNLPSLKLREFALRIFQHCPLMSQWSHYHHSTAFSEFLAYKTRVPVRGAILLNQEMDEVVLVKGWKKGANWSFPRGKINKEEKDLDCAVREVFEETGFDIKASGLIKDEKNVKYIEIPMREQNMRLYVLRGVPKNTHFEPRTRKEISKIEWYKLSDLPTLKKNKQQENVPYQNNNKFYMVATFLGPLKKWIAKQRKLDQARISHPHMIIQEELGGAIITEDEGVEDHQDITGGYPAHHVPSMPTLPPVHSDLPEVSAPLDPTIHLKRLLNIGSVAPATHSKQPDSDHQQQQQQHISNIDKGNALLQLLRKGSEAHPPEHPPLAPIPVHPSRALPTVHSQQTTPQPTPGQAVAPPPTHLDFGNQYLQHPQNQTDNQQLYNYLERKPAARPQDGYVGQTPHQASHEPAKPPFTAYPPPLRQIGPQPPSHSTQHITPPYHRTGDPQFVSDPQKLQSNMPSVPPAHALPLPKLNSHSLALLSVFKGDSLKNTVTIPGSISTPSVEAFKQEDAKAQHKSQLLEMLKQPSNSYSQNGGSLHLPDRAELATQNSPRIQGQSGMQPPGLSLSSQVKAPVILQNPHRPRTPTQPTVGKTGATLSAPLNLPNFEGIAKSPRSPRSPRREKKHAPAQTSMAKPNIRILPRPASNNNEGIPQTVKVHSPSPAPPRPNVKLSEVTKPFKPKILRRPDKDNLDAYLPTSTVTVSAFSKPEPLPVSDDDVVQNTQPQPQFDQRPSQSTAQKEALLSLFNKDPSSQPIGEKQDITTHTKSPVLVSPPFSTLISPTTDPLNSPKETTRGSGFEKQSSVASSSNQAFLLGYLEGVAMGKK
ncbi:mRNA-decapping enzyme 2 [Nannizzia gypsea CBS 118893]|uniref:mRNA-decapping enzyme 2 n=1 Tax=Arthroderma gypseum (strain ATCC MYA-4604 / CBS 118893) TaxID=535722 RepID=E4V3N6_ARTGP|nr:mRNA-decapping enzyme 2 [Nannizzia gypsea CBS 118893]EFR04610.1 mRNA-decapping enzyme 2 [Nannizzia gypsea CBS 118893]